LIERLLARYTTLDLRDYTELLHLRDDYRIVEVDLRGNSWLANSSLGQLNLPTEGVLVLGVQRSGERYIGAPPPGVRLCPSDLLVLYGRKDRLRELTNRAAGDQAAHDEATGAYSREREEQQSEVERMKAE
jgi:uncharacterized protein with PhoU and TrkA domain